MADFSIKANDTLPAFEVSLGIGGGSLDLTTAVSVTFIMREASGGTPKVHAAAIVDNPITGIVRYEWVDGDTDTPGQYQAEWEIAWTGGKKQTVPTTTYHSIDILADLDNA